MLIVPSSSLVLRLADQLDRIIACIRGGTFLLQTNLVGSSRLMSGDSSLLLNEANNLRRKPAIFFIRLGGLGELDATGRSYCSSARNISVLFQRPAAWVEADRAL